MTTSDAAKRTFLATADLSPDERGLVLAELRREDPELHARVARLLAAHDRAESMAARAPSASPTSTGAQPIELPARFGGYELLEVIASGGSGTVYRARQLDLQRTVAIKMLRAGRFASPAELRRFQMEAEAAARLDHPAIVPVFDVGSLDGQPFLSMKLVEGDGLDRVRHEYRDPRAAAGLVARIARALDHAHRRGVLHRDLKPSNVLIDARGRPFVADFGTAKLLDVENEHTMTGCIVGTPSYMAPEQVEVGGEVTVATDVYALGCVLYELLSGAPPITAPDLLGTLLRIREGRTTPLRAVCPDADRDLETICERCLAMEPARRYASAAALAEDLERWLAHEPITARPATTAERFRLFCRRRPVVSALVAAVALLLAILVAGAVVAGFELRAGLERVATAEAHAREQMRGAFLAEARALRSTGRAGARARALDLLSRAAAIRPGRDLVDAVVAIAALTDLEVVARQPLAQTDRLRLVPAFDTALERYVLGDPEGNAVLREFADNSVIGTLPGDGRPAWRPVFSRDGRFLSLTYHPSGSVEDARFVVWDLARREVVHALDERPLSHRFEFAPDRAAVLVATRDGRLVERDLQAGTDRTLFRTRHWGGAVAVRYAPDGDRIACSGAPNGATVLLATDGRTLREIPGDWSDYTIDLAWSPSGRQLATISRTAVIRVWDAGSGTLLQTLEGHRGESTRLLFPREDVVVSHAWDNTTRVWCLGVGEQVLQLQEQVTCASTDGTRLGFHTGDTIAVRSLVHGTALGRLDLHGADVHALDIRPDSTLVASVADGEFALWELATGRVRDRRSTAGFHAALFLDDRTLWVGSSDGLHAWDIQDGHLAATPELVLPEPCFHLARDAGASVVAAIAQGHLLLFTDESRAPIRIPLPYGSTRLAVSPGGEWVAAGCWRGSGVRVWNVRDGSLAAHLAPEVSDCIPHFSPDGQRVLVGTQRDYLLFRTGGFELERAVSRRTGARASAFVTRFSADGTAFVGLFGTPAMLTLVDTRSGTELVHFEPPDDAAPSYAGFAPDGRSLVVGTMSGRVHGWKLDVLARELASAGLASALEAPSGTAIGGGTPRVR